MARKPADQTVSREDVLAAAARVFRLHGYHGATMQLIGAELGLRQSSLYHYFPSKHTLLITLLNEGLDRLTRVVLVAAHPDLPADLRLDRAIHAYLHCVADFPDVALVTILEARAVFENPEERTSTLPAAMPSNPCLPPSSATASSRASFGLLTRPSSSRCYLACITGSWCGIAPTAVCQSRRSATLSANSSWPPLRREI